MNNIYQHVLKSTFAMTLGVAAVSLPAFSYAQDATKPVSYTHLTLPTTPYV